MSVDCLEGIAVAVAGPKLLLRYPLTNPDTVQPRTLPKTRGRGELKLHVMEGQG